MLSSCQQMSQMSPHPLTSSLRGGLPPIGTSTPAREGLSYSPRGATQANEDISSFSTTTKLRGEVRFPDGTPGLRPFSYTPSRTSKLKEDPSAFSTTTKLRGEAVFSVGTPGVDSFNFSAGPISSGITSGTVITAKF